MRILVTGSRNWPDFDRVGLEFLELLSSRWDWTPPATLVSGGCPTGADKMAEMWFERWEFNIERHPAQWDLYGRSAGFRRNEKMVLTRPDFGLAFQYQGSKGTQHTIDLMVRNQIPHKVIRLD